MGGFPPSFKKKNQLTIEYQNAEYFNLNHACIPLGDFTCPGRFYLSPLSINELLPSEHHNWNHLFFLSSSKNHIYEKPFNFFMHMNDQHTLN